MKAECVHYEDLEAERKIMMRKMMKSTLNTMINEPVFGFAELIIIALLITLLVMPL